jgi:SAM-dependent methyltransferase
VRLGKSNVKDLIWLAMQPAPLQRLSAAQLLRASADTLRHYEQAAQAFWQGTRGHDVSQNVEALLRHVQAPAPFRILDLGCGPGRDLQTFRQRGHQPVGLDGAQQFVTMAQAHTGCEVWHQDLLALDLPAQRFDGIFANAVLFHVPSQELPRVLTQLWHTLAEGGVLFASNPRGPDVEGFQGLRYGCYLSQARWTEYVTQAGFSELEHYFRPEGLPRAEQPWLATVWRKLMPG